MRHDIEVLKSEIIKWLDNLLSTEGDNIVTLRVFQTDWTFRAEADKNRGEVRWEKVDKKRQSKMPKKV